MSRAARIIAIAKGYIGQLELKGNQGFVNKDFGKKLIQVGFYQGAPWCAFFVKLVYGEAYYDIKFLHEAIAKNNTGGALDTLKRHENAGVFTVGETPKPGAIVLWRHGSGTTGHAGIVVAVDEANNTMTTVEGNTNANGSREGDRVAQKLRTITRPFQENGLNVAGYIYPFEI
nr:CHAP domain-containing protein [Mucilaginibacter sp. L294]